MGDPKLWVPLGSPAAIHAPLSKATHFKAFLPYLALGTILATHRNIAKSSSANLSKSPSHLEY